jgi:hypothetical protein
MYWKIQDVSSLQIAKKNEFSSIIKVIQKYYFEMSWPLLKFVGHKCPLYRSHKFHHKFRKSKRLEKLMTLFPPRMIHPYLIVSVYIRM